MLSNLEIVSDDWGCDAGDSPLNVLERQKTVAQLQKSWVIGDAFSCLNRHERTDA